MAYQHIRIENSGKIRIITISRESKLNALNAATIQELGQAIREVQEDEIIRAVILTGAGEKAFVAGADISEFADYDPAQGENLARQGQQLVFDAIYHSSKPFIAAINGFALGGGLELALACHIRIAAHHAKLGLPETTLGLIPGYGGTQRLTQLIGRGNAMELILTADMMSAEDAFRCGLVNGVVEVSQLLDAAYRLATRITTRSGSAIAAAIEAINASLDPRKDGYETEIEAFGKCFGTPDFVEGTRAFLEKRKPNF